MGNIRIRRQPQDYNIGEVSEKYISNVHWDNICGGYQIKVAVTSMYGYMDYDEACKTGIGISGTHNWGDNLAKVCMNKNDNTGKDNEAYEPTYCRFVVEADHNTKFRFIDYKKTKTVSDFLKAHSNGVTRKELMNNLVNDKEKATIIREAISTLYKAGYLLIEGSPRGQNSILKLVDEFPF